MTLNERLEEVAQACRDLARTYREHGVLEENWLTRAGAVEEALRELRAVRTELLKHVAARGDVPTVQVVEALGACLRHHQGRRSPAADAEIEMLRQRAETAEGHLVEIGKVLDAAGVRWGPGSEGPETIAEAVRGLEAERATLEAERMELRAALAARTCPAVHASAHGLLVCTREHGHAPPCSWKRKRPEEKCPVCTGACEWDKDTTG